RFSMDGTFLGDTPLSTPLSGLAYVKGVMYGVQDDRAYSVNLDNGNTTLLFTLPGLELWGASAPPALDAHLTGALDLQNCLNLVQNIEFTFRPTDNSGTFSRMITLNADGTFSIANLPHNVYTVHIKGPKWLAKNVSVDTTNGNVSGVMATLLGGD